MYYSANGNQLLVYLQCGLAFVANTVVHGPTNYYVQTVVHPAVCGINMTVGAESQSAIACSLLGARYA